MNALLQYMLPGLDTVHTRCVLHISFAASHDGGLTVEKICSRQIVIQPRWGMHAYELRMCQAFVLVVKLVHCCRVVRNCPKCVRGQQQRMPMGVPLKNGDLSVFSSCSIKRTENRYTGPGAPVRMPFVFFLVYQPGLPQLRRRFLSFYYQSIDRGSR